MSKRSTSKPEKLARIHQVLRVTPAMEAKFADHVWSLEEIFGLLVLANAKI
jgi:hypothetical protein